MRWEYVGTGLAILAVGVTIVLALPPPWWPKMPTPLVQIGVAFGLILFAIGFAITGVGTWPGLPEPRGPIAVTLLGVVLLVCGGAWWVFVPALGARTLARGSHVAGASRPAVALTKVKHTNLKAGSIRQIQANLQIDLSTSRKDASIQVQVKLINDTNETLRFHATTAGNINGIWFSYNKVEFDGYAAPHVPFYLLSRKIEGLKPLEGTDQNFLKVTAIYEYELKYGLLDDANYSRASARGIKIEQEMPIKIGNRGDRKVVP